MISETQNNRRLQYLTEEDVQAIFSGAVSNWSQLGGIDLPIKLISYEPKTRIAREFNKLVMEDEVQFSDDAIIVGSLEEMGDALKSHPGAVAYCYYMGTDYRLADSLSSSARTLSVHLYILVKEGISFEKGFLLQVHC